MVLLTVLVGTLFLIPLTAAIADQGFYLGASGGQAKLDKDDVDRVFEVSTWPANGIEGSFDFTGTVMKVYGGYHFNRNLAFEAAYEKMDGFEINARFTDGSGSAKVELEATTTLLTGVGAFPFDSGITLFAKLGMARTTSKATCTCTGTGTMSNCSNDVGGSEKEWDPAYGLGVSYDFTKNIAARIEWERIKDSGDRDNIGLDLTTLGVQYNF